MPVSRADAEGLAERLTNLYRDLEEELVAGIARRLARGMDRADWQEEKLRGVGELRRWAARLTSRLAERNGPEAARAIGAAFKRGADAAERELAAAGDVERVRRAVPGMGAINRLATALTGSLGGMQLPIVRSVVDVYQQVVSTGAATDVLGGALTRREASQKAWNKLLDKGITGFTDRAGRNWSLSGYVEMATRTAVGQAAVTGHLDRLDAAGIDLVIVSDAAQECARCRPWEGKVLTRDESGRGGLDLRVEHAIDDRFINVRVKGSVSEAIRDGLMHPQCRHTLSAYLPGLTRAPKRTADPEGDAARQHLRALERQVRAGALSPQARSEALSAVRAGQARIKEHVDATKHLGIKRKSEREQLDLGNKRATAELTPAERLRADVASGVKGERRLGGGAMGVVHKIETNSGRTLVRKRAMDSAGRPAIEQQDAEELGALVLRTIGGRAPIVARAAEDLVHMEFVDGIVWDEVEDTALRAKAEWSDDARMIALSDVLMGNVDRNAGNAIIDSAGHVWGIDHGGAFDWHEEYNPPDALPRYRNLFDERLADGVGPDEVARLRERLVTLEPEFRRLKRDAWYRDMLRRLKALEAS